MQEVRKMRFEEAYSGWQERRLTQEEAARLLGLCERTFRRYIDRYEDDGLDGLADKRLFQTADIAVAPVSEPGTIILLGTALIGLAGFDRKKLIKKDITG
jgi:hypothetical protein